MDMSALKQKMTGWVGKYKFVLLIVLAGVCLMLIPAKEKEQPQQTPESVMTVPQQSIHEELEAILSNIHGAGKVQVMLTVKAGEQVLYQTDKPAQDRQDTVIVTDKDRAQGGLVQQVISPSYRGAIILCQGAERAGIRLAIIEAVSKVTGLDASEISVLKMK